MMSEGWDELVLPWCLLAIALAILLALARLLRGPTGGDRVMALDLVTILAAGVVGVLAVLEDRADYLSVALVIALISFLGTVALSVFLARAEDEGGAQQERRKR